MSIEAINAVFKCEHLTSTETLISIYIADKVNSDHDWEFYGSIANLIRFTKIEKNTVYKSISALVDKGYLTKTGEKKKRQNVYVFNIDKYVQNAYKENEPKKKCPERRTVKCPERRTHKSEKCPKRRTHIEHNINNSKINTNKMVCDSVSQEKFIEFMKEYPKKQPGRKQAQELFIKEQYYLELNAIIKHIQYMKANNWATCDDRYIPHPNNYLKAESWRDAEFEPSRDELKDMREQYLDDCEKKGISPMPFLNWLNKIQQER